MRSAVRCPWCHEDVDVASSDWLACRACLARHHEECWQAAQRCATCGSAESLVTPSLRARDGAEDVAGVDVEELRREAALANLELEWREQFGSQPARPLLDEPVAPGVVAGGFAALMSALAFALLIAVASGVESARLFVFFALSALVMGIFGAFAIHRAACTDRAVRARFLARREAILRGDGRDPGAPRRLPCRS